MVAFLRVCVTWNCENLGKERGEKKRREKKKRGEPLAWPLETNTVKLQPWHFNWVKLYLEMSWLIATESSNSHLSLFISAKSLLGKELIEMYQQFSSSQRSNLPNIFCLVAGYHSPNASTVSSGRRKSSEFAFRCNFPLAFLNGEQSIYKQSEHTGYFSAFSQFKVWLLPVGNQFFMRAFGRSS